jgi:pimeloyl-ACP methyl ester carboxylesterase
MFSETRYALNGDLRVAYRASDEGERDIVFVSPPFTNCEVFPELPYIQGWFEAMTSLGRLIFFDQPGTGVSDHVTPTLELRADSITAGYYIPHQRETPRPSALGVDYSKAPTADETEWELRGLCNDYDGDLWYPESPQLEYKAMRAKGICHSCPVIAQCREWGLAKHEKFGVWGGLRRGIARSSGTA